MPRTNRGIFAINELPDLAERIQVGLLNVLEERDVQVRGYKIRLPLDVLLVASANPEDYTNRGRIITPLKDRFGAQIRTHYPLDVDTEVAIAEQEARPLDGARHPRLGARVHGRDRGHAVAPRPPEPAHQPALGRVGAAHGLEPRDARRQRHPARAACTARPRSCPRVSDLEALASSTAGKVEIEALEEGRDEQIVEHLLRAAVLTVFKERVGTEAVRERDRRVRRTATSSHAGDDVVSADEAKLLVGHPGAAATGRRPDRWRRVSRPRWPAPSSSSSRGCTSPSASTRTPSAPAPPTAVAG